MKNLTKKGFLNKLIIVFLVIIVFNAAIPMNKSQATDYKVGGVLLKPINQLVLKVADGVVDLIHKVIFGSSTSLLEYDIHSNWKLIVIIMAVVISIIVVLSAVMIAPEIVAGIAAITKAMGMGALSFSTVGAIATIVKVGVGATAFAAMYINVNWFGDVAVLPIYKISPQEIFRGEIGILNANFFSNEENDESTVKNEWYEVARNTYEEGTLSSAIPQVNEYLKNSGCPDNLLLSTDYPINGKEYDETIEWSSNDTNYKAKITGSIRYMTLGNYTGTICLTLFSNNPLVNNQPITLQLKPTIAKWYYTLRNLAIVLMLLELVYIGIRVMLCSIASEKAKYKNMLKDWVVAICLIFVMHYIMAFANNLVDAFTKLIGSFDSGHNYVVYIDDDEQKLQTALKSGDYPLSEDEIVHPTDENGVTDQNKIIWNCSNLMGMARYQAALQGDVPGVSYIGYTIAFVVLVFYTLFFLFTYLRRVIYLAFLTLIAPMVAFTYPLDKINDGKAQAFDMWFKEYIFNLLIQPFHLILYTVLISSAFDLASENILYTLVAIGFLMPAEKLLRRFFGFEKAQTPGMLGGAVGASLVMNGMNRLLHGKPPHPPKPGEGNSAKIKENEKFADLTSGEGIDNSLLFESNLSSGNSNSAGGNMPTNSQNNASSQNNTNSPNNANLQNNANNNQRRLIQTASGNNSSSQSASTSNVSSQNSQITVGKDKDDKIKAFLKRHPKLRGGLGLAKSYAGQQFKRTTKGVGKAIRKMPKIAAGAALGTATGMVGVAAGIASGDISKVGQYGGAAMAGGYTLGGSLEEFASGVLKVNDKELENAYERSYYGSNEEYRQAKIEERRKNYIKDDRHIAEVQHYTGEDEKYAKMVLEENSDCIDAGITDVKDILAVDHMVEEEGWSREKAMTATKMLSREAKPIEDMNQEELSHFEFRAKNAIRAQGVTDENNVDIAYQQMKDNLIKVSKAKKAVTKVKRLTSDEISQKEEKRNERMKNYEQNKRQQLELEREEKNRKRQANRKKQNNNPGIETPIRQVNINNK